MHNVNPNFNDIRKIILEDLRVKFKNQNNKQKAVINKSIDNFNFNF